MQKAGTGDALAHTRPFECACGAEIYDMRSMLFTQLFELFVELLM
jgi:hypothetical protein